MELIDEFITRYTRELDFYDQAGRLAAQLLRRHLDESGIRAIVTSRAKSIPRLRDKCIGRMSDKNYQTIDDIYRDIVDLAGVRVALYFPSEQSQVERIVRDLFDLIEDRIDFPDKSKEREGRTFSGYHAQHFRGKIKPGELPETETRYTLAPLEIQVASLLMHAWSEVDHDLDYKPVSGRLSPEEVAVLDQLNGLVLAGEIALKQLQEAGERRVSKGDQFANHYDLATYLLARARVLGERQISESDMGRIRHLFELLNRLEITAPGDLEQFLKALHDDFEMRPLADQIIDAILASDPQRYEIWGQVRQQLEADQGGTSTDPFRDAGEFIIHWIELEKLIVSATPGIESNRTIAHRMRPAFDRGILDERLVAEIDSLRRLRNNLVHGAHEPMAEELKEAIPRLESILAEVRHRIDNLPAE